mmetsp:Transcript_9235/g.21958  ORF Transcript_9235/g.21958 Transcript_9235/m.21958 type:complete len:217 (-) Transcript_9235:416-1066(-)
MQRDTPAKGLPQPARIPHAPWIHCGPPAGQDLVASSAHAVDDILWPKIAENPVVGKHDDQKLHGDDGKGNDAHGRQLASILHGAPEGRQSDDDCEGVHDVGEHGEEAEEGFKGRLFTTHVDAHTSIRLVPCRGTIRVEVVQIFKLRESTSVDADQAKERKANAYPRRVVQQMSDVHIAVEQRGGRQQDCPPFAPTIVWIATQGPVPSDRRGDLHVA